RDALKNIVYTKKDTPIHIYNKKEDETNKPKKTSSAPEIFLVKVYILLLLFKMAPLATKYQIKKITIKSGRDVPIPKTAGSTTPYEVTTTIGINVSKNNTNIVGQKASVKLTPIKKLPK